MALAHTVTSLTYEIKESQRKARFADYEIGDIVQFIDTNGSSVNGIIIKKSEYPFLTTFMYTPNTSFRYYLLTANVDCYYKLFFVSEELINRLREGISFHNPLYIDNLTLVEVLHNLNRYESKFE